MKLLFGVVRRVVLAATLFVASAAQAQAATDAQCFAETGYCIEGTIRVYWEQRGGLFVLGYPISALVTETRDGQERATQWFERERLTVTPEGAVVGSALGVEVLAMRGTPWETLPKQDAHSADCRFFPETGQSICNRDFLSYFDRAGGRDTFGHPISDQLRETIDGQEYLVQYFEKKRMEWHPNPRAEGGKVRLGRLGSEIRRLS
jgi:hypothetical protein